MKKLYKIGEFSDMLNVSKDTLRDWESKGKLIPIRSPGGTRYYTHEQYLEYIGELPLKQDIKKVVIYARVATRNQKDDLENQVQYLREWVNARGYIVEDVITDFGSGLNYKRKAWNKMLDDVIEHKISTIIIAHKDRFVRFGFDWFDKFCNKFGTEIIVVNNEKLSPEAELVDDIVSILHVFSCRLYGLRKYKKEIENEQRKHTT